jgi:dipeptidyl-peptidase-4
MAVPFPRQQARTRRFSLGAPRSFTISPGGERVVFLRSPAGDDPATSLWVYEVATGEEREVASAAAILGASNEEVPAEERARRERSRELAGGIVGYACDEAVSHAAVALGGKLWWVPLLAAGDGRGAVELPALPGVVDPRPDPTGSAVAFLAGAGLYLVPTEGQHAVTLLALEAGEVTWGAAEFIAAEEMGRNRGFWWAPDGRSLLAARVDNAPVATWWTADPSRPAQPPQPHRYPVAGGPDALVSLWHLGAAPDGAPRREVVWDNARYPYLAAVHWSRWGPPLLVVEQRDHKASTVLSVDLASGATTVLVEDADDAWVDLTPGLPAWLEDGRLVWAATDAGTRRLRVGDELVTPPGLQVREVTSVGQSVVFSASGADEPEVIEAWRWQGSGRRAGGIVRLTASRNGGSAAGDEPRPGVVGALGDGRVAVVTERSMDWHGARHAVCVDGSEPRWLGSRAEEPVVEPVVYFLKVGERRLSVGVVLPTGHDGGTLPVVMAPYGGPGHQMVLAARSAWLQAQWLADQGFAVVVADGRGTPGRGPAWEREVYRDLAGPALEDQVEALQGAAREVPELDLGRVGIRGWSFGGYLAALAVLARPDVFHAAVAGAPVTDWRLYDTYYTERFLGHPDAEQEAYERSSLLHLASRLSRPLLLVHGLADDNVYSAHTLRLSAELLRAGRPHSVTPLPGITHVAAREEVAEALMLLEVDFFRRSLA